MKLTLKNIGKVEKASVEINGITVIAGENSTGKSTVGRALFAVFNSFHNVQKQIQNARVDSIENYLDRMCMTVNGTIEPNGAIILDEPEIHLHPEWQLLFAELIVLIQKEFGVHILLNTHSPYFLRAIQVYSATHGIADICKYYLSEVVNEYATLTDVTENIEQIYAKLARPLQKLEDERWKDG